MEECKIDFNSMAWKSTANGSRFKMFQEGNTKLRIVEFTKSFCEQDWCTKGHVGLVLEGEGDVDFNGKTVKYLPGDGVFIPAGLEYKHKLKVVTDVIRLVLVEWETQNRPGCPPARQ
jgi:hypothetical protein